MLQRARTSFSFSLSLPYEVISWPFELFSWFIQSVAARVPSHLAEGKEQNPQQLHCFLQRTWLPLSLHFLALGNNRLQNQMLHRSLDNNLKKMTIACLLACSIGFLFSLESLLRMLPALKERFLAYLHRHLILSGRSLTTDLQKTRLIFLYNIFHRMLVHFIYSKNSLGDSFVLEPDLKIKSLSDNLINN